MNGITHACDHPVVYSALIGYEPHSFHRPLIQVKLEVLCQAGLAKEDFSKADSTTVKVTLHDLLIIYV